MLFSEQMERINQNFQLKPIVFSAVVLILFVLPILYGIGFSPDSFAYIDGAKNILLKNGYEYDANSMPITLFPPAYSLVLAFSFKILGFKVLSITILNALFFTLSFLLIYHFNHLAKKYSLIWIFLMAIILGILYKNMQNALSESLFIPVFLLWLLVQNHLKDKLGKYFLVVVIALEIIMIATRYASILIIFAYYFSQNILNVYQKGKISFLKINILNDVVVPLMSLIFFIVLRRKITGNGSHHSFILGSGKFQFFDYIKQITNDLGDALLGSALSFQLNKYQVLFIVSIILIALFMLVFKIIIPKKIGLFLLICTLINVVFLCNVWVDDGLSGRYFCWFYLTLALFAKVEVKHTLNKISFIFIFLFTSLQLVNQIYFVRQKYLKSNETQTVQFAKYSVFFKAGQFQLYEEREPAYKQNELGEVSLLSPCYRWNIPQK